jgi:hypothetical protein
MKYNPKKSNWAMFMILHLLIPFFWGCTHINENDLTGTWEMTEYRINHFDEHEDIEVQWNFLKDGAFSQLITYPQNEVRESGSWVMKDEQTILIEYPHNNMKVEWKIVYIDSALLKVEHTTPGFFVERSFRKQ